MDGECWVFLMTEGLPWIARGLILVEFVLVDELPSPDIRRVAILSGILLVTVTALAGRWSPQLVPVPSSLLVGSGALSAAMPAIIEAARRPDLTYAGRGDLAPDRSTTACRAITPFSGASLC